MIQEIINGLLTLALYEFIFRPILFGGGNEMCRHKYPWYTYVGNILRNDQTNITQRERDAVNAAFETAKPETRELVRIVCVKRSKDMHRAASDMYISYSTAFRRIHAFKMEVARNLGLLEE